MISDATKSRPEKAIDNPKAYCFGARRKQLQATYDKLLDEISVKVFEERCTSRMQFRQKVNRLKDDSQISKSLKRMVRDQEVIFKKDYLDHSEEIAKFLTDDLAHFLEAIRRE